MSHRRHTDAVERDRAVLARNGLTATKKTHDKALRAAAQVLEALEWGHDALAFGVLRRANWKRCEQHYHPIGDWSLTDWMTCVTGEVGELASLIKNLRRKQTEREMNGHAIPAATLEELGNEAADIVVYLDLLCTRAGIDLGAAVRRKFNLVSRDRLGSDIVL